MTSAEFGVYVEGWNWQREQEWERSAWMVSYQVASMTGEKLSVDELLGRTKREPEMSNEEKFAELMKRMGKKWDPTEVPS